MQLASAGPESFHRTVRAGISLGALCAALWLLIGVAAAQSLEVIELEHRTAEEVIPVLEPLLEKGAALTGQDYRLFVRTSAANLAQLRSALAQIDRKPRQLLVSVRRATRQQVERERLEATGTARAGNVAVAVDEPARPASGATIHATDSSRSRREDIVSSVQVLEGHSALIATGTSVPLVTAVAAGGGRRPWAAASTTYRDLGSGFLVTPRVRGAHVVLDVEQRDERIARGQIETQQLATQVRGALGEWIALGGISESAQSRERGLAGGRYATQADERSVWIKVEER